MTDIQAALGLHQLTKLERFQQIREGIVKTYDRGFETVPEVLLPFRNESTKHAWHLYVIQLLRLLAL